MGADMRTYDSWKADAYDAWMGEPPEVIITCDECGGEGAIEVYEAVSKWSIDPPCGRCVTCPSCKGQGIFIEEAEPDHDY